MLALRRRDVCISQAQTLDGKLVYWMFNIDNIGMWRGQWPMLTAKQWCVRAYDLLIKARDYLFWIFWRYW